MSVLEWLVVVPVTCAEKVNMEQIFELRDWIHYIGTLGKSWECIRYVVVP